MRKKIIRAIDYLAKNPDDYILPDWKAIAESYIDYYGSNLMKLSIGNKNKEEKLSQYGLFYKFCLDCRDLSRCRVGKILKENPLLFHFIKPYRMFLKNELDKYLDMRPKLDRDLWTNLIKDVADTQERATAVFKECLYRKIALVIIERNKKSLS